MKEAEKRNQELIREIKALQRIQNEQGKALEKMTTENDYVSKIKNLMDELRLAREKVKDLEGELANKRAFLDMAKKAAADFSRVGVRPLPVHPGGRRVLRR